MFKINDKQTKIPSIIQNQNSFTDFEKSEPKKRTTECMENMKKGI